MILPTRNQGTAGRKMRGVSIVESLVALVVISVGMLGIAGLYLTSLQAGRSAKMRSQAVNLASSLADRIRANRLAARADYLTATYSGAPATQNCMAAACTPAALAQDDLARWIADIRADLPGVPATTTGTVTFTAGVAPNPADTFLITINWREANSDIDFSYSLPLSLSRNL